jgi:hypothetical protein
MRRRSSFSRRFGSPSAASDCSARRRWVSAIVTSRSRCSFTRCRRRPTSASASRAICSSGDSGSVEATRSESRPGLGSPATNDFHSSGRSLRRSMIRSAFAIACRQIASRSGEGTSISGMGSTRTRRHGSSATASPRCARTMPTTIACLLSPRASITRATRTMHATGWRSATRGSSVSASRWLAISSSPPCRASASAARDFGRPMASGRVTPGKTTASRTGRSGSTSGTWSCSPLATVTARLCPWATNPPSSSPRAAGSPCPPGGSPAKLNAPPARSTELESGRRGARSRRRRPRRRRAIHPTPRGRTGAGRGDETARGRPPRRQRGGAQGLGDPARRRRWCPGLDSNQHEVALTSS